MSFDAAIRGTWSSAECAALRQEAEYWEAYDELPSHLGWTPGASLAARDAEITLSLYDRIIEARRGYREAMESLGVGWDEDDEEDGIVFVTYGEPGYGKTFMVEGTIGPIEVGLDEYERFLYGEIARPYDWVEDIEWED